MTKVTSFAGMSPAEWQVFQESVQKSVDSGNHPFIRMAMLSRTRPEGVFIPVIRATVETNIDRKSPEFFDSVDSDLLTRCMPLWDIAESNFEKFDLHVHVKRDLQSFRYQITVSLILEPGTDLDTFLMMLKLGGIEECMNKTYDRDWVPGQ